MNTRGCSVPGCDRTHCAKGHALQYAARQWAIVTTLWRQAGNLTRWDAA